jgi:FG-GAP repeat protein
MPSLPNRSPRSLIFALSAVALAATATPAGAQLLYEDFSILPNDGVVSNFFGFSVASNGGRTVVGAYGQNPAGTQSGAAYLFKSNNGQFINKLIPNDGGPLARFGWDIAMDDGIIVVSAYRDDEQADNAGAVYLFDDLFGNQISKILPDFGFPNAEFGYSVDIDNGVVIVGAPLSDRFHFREGVAYLFDASTGQILQTLRPDYDSRTNNTRFGWDVAIDNGMAVVSSRFVAGDTTDDDGGVWVFDVATGDLIVEILPTISIDSRFGFQVELGGGLLAISRPNYLSGRVSIYNPMTGTRLRTIDPDNISVWGYFGTSLSMEGSRLLIGAAADDIYGNGSGSAFLYDAATGLQLAKFAPSAGASNEYFGQSVALNGGVVSVGAYDASPNGGNSGAAYGFNIYSILCPTDLTNDGQLNFFDVQAFLALFAAQDPAADLNFDTLYDFFDVQAYLAAFSAGCP